MKVTIITFLAFFLACCVSAQDMSTYLKNNSADITEGLSKNSIINKDFLDHQIFLLGESHGYQAPQTIDFNFLKFLNRNAGIRIYLAEIDFAKAYFLNKYLNKGDETLIDTVFADWVREDAQWANKDFQQKIRKIRSLNLTLPAKRRIFFAGIDQIQNPALVADYFAELFSRKPFKDYGEKFRQLSSLLRMGNDSLISNEASQLSEAMDKGEFNGIRGKNAITLKFALLNCISIAAKSREKVFYDNFKYYYQLYHWKNEKLYGLWGFFHVIQARTDAGKTASFAVRLLADSSLNLKNKIVSVGFFYVDSKMAMPTIFMDPGMHAKGRHFTESGFMNYDGPLTTFPFIGDFKRATLANTNTLISLVGTDSPFTTQAFKINYSSFMPASQRIQLDEPGKSMTDYLQYIILVRNSPAVSTLLQ